MELDRGLSRRRVLGLLGMAAVAAGCGSSVDDDDDEATGTSAAPGTTPTAFQATGTPQLAASRVGASQ